MIQTTSRWHQARGYRPAMIALGIMTVAGAFFLVSSNLTNAAYTDKATAERAIGNPNEFRLETREQGGNWKTSAPAAAPSIVAVTNPEGSIGVLTTIGTTLEVRVAAGGPTGAIVPSLLPSQACLDRIAALDSGPNADTWRTTTPREDCQKVFDNLLFSVTWNGRMVAIATSAAEFNQIASRRLAGALPGVSYQLEIVAKVSPMLPFKYNTASTGVGVAFTGTSETTS
ncbi:hypothetical protein [Lysinibacter cavernae]|uniref:Uncharacterized protein n=1 Tax=Lysinibacter cavernae TaxID=1640652 RepID=A0A7X5R0N6_9MICO|nr:hypothetical protein [Lysinibacter cavernae]NIH53520.1 hypothetical protein [Lysinibacter cavernae]